MSLVNRLSPFTGFQLAIIELEVANRTVVDMRRDYATYFLDASVFCVIGVKVFIGIGKDC
jgi:hypothetical protein